VFDQYGSRGRSDFDTSTRSRGGSLTAISDRRPVTTRRSPRFSPARGPCSDPCHLLRSSCASPSRTRVSGRESPPNLTDSPQAHTSTLPIVEQPPGKFSDYAEPQATIAKSPDMTPREVREEPDSIQQQSESGLEPIEKGFGIDVPIPEPVPASIPIPEPVPVSIPAPEPTPVVIQVPEQQVPQTRVVSDVRELPLMGPTVFTVPPPEDHSPWASVIRTRTDNLSLYTTESRATKFTRSHIWGR